MDSRYVLIKIAGRSWSAVYHEIAADGSSPQCGAALNGGEWALQQRARVGQRHRCEHCRAASERESSAEEREGR